MHNSSNQNAANEETALLPHNDSDQRIKSTIKAVFGNVYARTSIDSILTSGALNACVGQYLTTFQDKFTSENIFKHTISLSQGYVFSISGIIDSTLRVIAEINKHRWPKLKKITEISGGFAGGLGLHAFILQFILFSSMNICTSLFEQGLVKSCSGKEACAELENQVCYIEIREGDSYVQVHNWWIFLPAVFLALSFAFFNNDAGANLLKRQKKLARSLDVFTALIVGGVATYGLARGAEYAIAEIFNKDVANTLATEIINLIISVSGALALSGIAFIKTANAAVVKAVGDAALGHGLVYWLEQHIIQKTGWSWFIPASVSGRVVRYSAATCSMAFSAYKTRKILDVADKPEDIGPKFSLLKSNIIASLLLTGIIEVIKVSESPYQAMFSILLCLYVLEPLIILLVKNFNLSNMPITGERQAAQDNALTDDLVTIEIPPREINTINEDNIAVINLAKEKPQRNKGAANLAASQGFFRVNNGDEEQNTNRLHALFRRCTIV